MNSLKRRLQGGDRLTGCWASLCSNLAAEIMARSGYDVTLIDLEHGPGGYLDAVALMQAVNSGGSAPMIRCTSSGIADIKRALDIGPAGILVPDVRNGEHAREVVAHCRYPPGGDRGAAPGFIRATGFDPGDGLAGDYERFMREAFLLAVQVESVEAVGAIDDIARTEGVDMIFVGPVDLSASLGKLGEFATDEFTRAMDHISSATLAAGKYLGGIRFADYTPRRLYRAGYHLVVSGADTVLLTRGARQDIKELADALSERPS